MKDPWLEEQLPRFFRLSQGPGSVAVADATQVSERSVLSRGHSQRVCRVAGSPTGTLEEDSSVSYHEIVQQGMAIKRYADVLVKDQARAWAFIGTLRRI